MNEVNFKEYAENEKVAVLDGRVDDCCLKPDHRLVWQALEAGNEARRRIINVGEIAEFLNDEASARLRKAFVKELKKAVSVILELLSKRGLVFIKNINNRRYYGSFRLLNPADGEFLLEADVSRRQLILNLAREAVEYYRRPVRAEDLIEFAEADKKTVSAEKFLIVRDLRSLSETGELRIVCALRGDGGGRNLYLPAEANPGDYPGDTSVTWLECVSEAFQALWKENCLRAENENSLPQAITTAAVRAALESSNEPHVRLKEPRAVTNALKSLSESKKASVRRIKIRRTGAVLWVPANIADEAVAQFGGEGDNSNKIARAVERAEVELHRPVTAADVKKEIQSDSHLRLNGKQSVARTLSELSKTNISDGTNDRSRRAVPLIRNVGSVDGKSFYTSIKYDVEAAKIYVEFSGCESAWENFTRTENIPEISQCRLFSVQRGRIILLQSEADVLRRKLLKLLLNKNIDYPLRRSVEKLLRQVEETVATTGKWLQNHSTDDLPAEVNNEVVGLTAAELLSVYRPLYPITANIKDPNRITTLCKTRICRIPNGNFVSRFSPETSEAAEHLFERTDAMLHAAVRWGGNECRYQALIAKSELGLLRDARFILPELKSDSYEKRTAATACLAFLQCRENNEQLYRVLRDDPIENVRYTALWAYAFSRGSKKILTCLIEKDSSKKVREFGSTIINSEYEKLWFL